MGTCSKTSNEALNRTCPLGAARCAALEGESIGPAVLFLPSVFFPATAGKIAPTRPHALAPERVFRMLHSQQAMSAPLDIPVALSDQRRITVADFHRMVDAGVFAPDERVELLEGVLIAMPPPGEPHSW